MAPRPRHVTNTSSHESLYLTSPPFHQHPANTTLWTTTPHPHGRPHKHHSHSHQAVSPPGTLSPAPPPPPQHHPRDPPQLLAVAQPAGVRRSRPCVLTSRRGMIMSLRLWSIVPRALLRGTGNLIPLLWYSVLRLRRRLIRAGRSGRVVFLPRHQQRPQSQHQYRSQSNSPHSHLSLQSLLHQQDRNSSPCQLDSEV